MTLKVKIYLVGQDVDSRSTSNNDLVDLEYI